MTSKKKVAKKKSPAKKATPVTKAAAKKKKAVKKKAPRRAATADKKALTLSVEFRLGGGSITGSLFRKGILIEEKTVDSTGSKTFADAKEGDELSLNGTSGGKATLTTDRSTRPASTVATPRKYEDQSVMDSLEILK